MSNNEQPEVQTLIPHREQMLLLDKIVQVNGIQLVAQSTVRPNCLFLRRGLLEPCALVEYMAQAMAALVGFNGLQSPEGKVYLGYLVGIRNLQLTQSTIKPGDTLKITIVEDGCLGDYGSYLGEVFLGEEMVCSGNLKVFRDSKAVAA